jgi:hypothetical protein
MLDLLTAFRSHLRLATLGALVVCAAAVPAMALADGDPASDVLIGQTLFMPADAGASAAQQAELQELQRAAARAGYPVRVAVIASPSDLGSVTALWQQPRAYARFLGYELALVFHGPLLVVMPGGFGLNHPGASLGAEQSALSRTRPPSAAGGLTLAAMRAVRSVAAAATGHQLPSAIASGALRAGAPGGSGQPLSLVVFALGAALIAFAWAASLRARPLRVRRRSGSA